MTALSQHGRLARLQTALGADCLVVHEACVWEAVGPCPDAGLAAPARQLPWLPWAEDEVQPAVGFRIELVALADDRGLDLAGLHGTPARLDLQTAAGLRPWHGHVREAGWLGGDGGLARVRLLIEPWIAWLHDEQHAEVFHEASVVEIVDRVLGRPRAGGDPAPAWRWALADAARLPRRGRCVQAHESDLGFVERLLLDEGLSHWFEHEADAEAPGGGRHRLVIADHAGAFAPGPCVRYAPGGTGPQEDTLARWSREQRLGTGRLRWASRDDRRVDLRPVAAGDEVWPGLEAVDVADGYAYPTREDGARRAAARLEALAYDAIRCRASGGWRDAAAGACFTLTGHPLHDGSDAARDRFVVSAVRHELRNDVAAGPMPSGTPGTPGAAAGPGHRCELVARPASLAPRRVPRDGQGRPELRLAPEADAPGLGSALVVGDGAPVATDRDHRVLLRFHWEQARDDGTAPATGDAASTAGRWVRVATPVAGDGWGGVNPPRAGQEALLGFVAARHDRPLVLGTLYGSAGHEDEADAFTATARPPWRPDAGTPSPGPALGGTLSGWRTRELHGGGAAGGRGNQLVFDDSPGAERVELGSDEAATRLQLGHLREQQDGRPLAPRGAGLDLRSEAWGALRAGGGLLLSSHAHPGSQHEGRQLDAAEALARLQAAQRMAAPDAPAGGGTTQALDALCARLEAAAKAPGWSCPDLLLAAPEGVFVASAGDTMQACDGDSEAFAQRLQQLAGRHLGLVAGGELRLQAAGDGGGSVLPTLCLHAAEGPATVRAGAGATVQAQGDVRIASCEATLDVRGAQSIRLGAAGASLCIDGHGITLAAPGTVLIGGGPVRMDAGRSVAADTPPT